MSDANHETSNPADAPSPPPPEDDLRPAIAGDDIYEVSESEPVEAAAGAGPVPSGGWYLCRAGGQPQGPFDLSEMKRRILSGELAAKDLVWSNGLPGWTAAGDVPELFAVRGVPPGPPPLRRATPTPQPAEIIQNINAVFSDPRLYRITGYVGAALAALIFLVSLVLWAWGRTWFTGAAVFALLFFLGQAAAALLEAIERLQSHSAAEKEPRANSR